MGTHIWMYHKIVDSAATNNPIGTRRQNLRVTETLFSELSPLSTTCRCLYLHYLVKLNVSASGTGAIANVCIS